MSRSRGADALAAAAETLDDLGVDQSTVIDPFAAVRQLGLTLHVARLDNLLGAVIPEGNGGVLITSQRRASIQRFTAAHEIGHWVLHRDQLMTDDEQDILGRPNSAMEREAQLFASYFMMPTALLDQSVAAYRDRDGRIGVEHIYLISRDLNVSYEAAARRLRAAHIIDQQDLNEALRVGRMSAMQQAFEGRRPDDGWAQLWDATSDDETVSLSVEELDEVVVQLPEHRMSGWLWLTPTQLANRNEGWPTPRPRPVAPAAAHNVGSTGVEDVLLPMPTRAPISARRPVDVEASLSLVRSDLVSNDDLAGRTDVTDAVGELDDEDESAAIVEDLFAAPGSSPSASVRRRQRVARAGLVRRDNVQRQGDDPALLVGGPGVHTFVVRCTEPGEWTLRLYYAHAYDPTVEPVDRYRVDLDIEASPTHSFQQARLHANLDSRLPGDPADDAELDVVVVDA